MSDIAGRRCQFTHNPCGTDTWEAHTPCRCRECQAWLMECTHGQGIEIEHLRADLAYSHENTVLLGQSLNEANGRYLRMEAELAKLRAVAEAALAVAYAYGDTAHLREIIADYSDRIWPLEEALREVRAALDSPASATEGDAHE
jgi:hypothetical protein